MASIVVSTNPADFALTSEGFSNTPTTNSNIVSLSGNITLDNADGVGNPPTGMHGYFEAGDAGPVLTGAEYVLNGDENFDIIFTSPQLAFAMDYGDQDTDSLFTLTFFNGALNLAPQRSPVQPHLPPLSLLDSSAT